MAQLNIVVGVDGSPESLSAVAWAVARARLTGARVHIVCTYVVAAYSSVALDGGYAGLDADALQRGAQQVIEESVHYASECDSSVTVTSSIEAGDAAGVLVDLSAEADLVVVGSRGGGGFVERLFGTVSSALPAHAQCPVIVVPSHTSGKSFTPVERIVVGVDGAEKASPALHYAVDEAVIWDSQLTAVSAVPIATGTGLLSWAPHVVDHEALMTSMRQGLGALVDATVGDRPLRVARHVLDGSPSSLLIEFSTAVDLVVVGSRGGGGFAGVLLGSTAHTVLSHSTCPVMIVPAACFDALPDTYEWERRH